MRTRTWIGMAVLVAGAGLLGFGLALPIEADGPQRESISGNANSVALTEELATLKRVKGSDFEVIYMPHIIAADR